MSVRFVLKKQLGSFRLEASLETSSKRLVLFGPSGSGKSLTLQCLAGLLTPENGSVEVNERILFDSVSGQNVPPQRRRIGYVPQSYALFPHLSIAGNVGYGLRLLSAKDRQQRVDALLRLVRLPDYQSRRPDELSGGEQQRVSLARALASEPELLLLDEPFSALDTPVRAAMRQELLNLQHDLDFAWVFVTHDLEEAYLLAEEVAVYHGGRILQAGPRDEVFYRPRSVEVARLVGVANIIPAHWDGCRLVAEPSGHVLAARSHELRVKREELDGQRHLDSALSTQHSALSDSVWACVRQEDVRVIRKDRPAGQLIEGVRLTGKMVSERQLGFTVTMQFEIDGGREPLQLAVDLPVQAYRSMHMDEAGQWELFIPSEAVHLIPRPDESTLA